MKITFLGDVHGYINRIPKLEGMVIQIGDLGIGFGVNENSIIKPVTHFIRGNHDHPQLTIKHPAYMGEFGFNSDHNLFHMGGAASPDFFIKTAIPGYDWWPDEQLNQDNLYDALQLYKKVKPRIMVTHDCPYSIMCDLEIVREPHKNNTNLTLDDMLYYHQPELWIFGHHHKAIDEMEDRTRFVCLPILDYLTIDTDWEVL